MWRLRHLTWHKLLIDPAVWHVISVLDFWLASFTFLQRQCPHLKEELHKALNLRDTAKIRQLFYNRDFGITEKKSHCCNLIADSYILWVLNPMGNQSFNLSFFAHKNNSGIAKNNNYWYCYPSRMESKSMAGYLSKIHQVSITVCSYPFIPLVREEHCEGKVHCSRTTHYDKAWAKPRAQLFEG